MLVSDWLLNGCMQSCLHVDDATSRRTKLRRRQRSEACADVLLAIIRDTTLSCTGTTFTYCVAASSAHPCHNQTAPLNRIACDLQVWDTSTLGSLKQPAESSGSPAKLQTKSAVVAHDKDINAVAVSPDDSVAATASRTALSRCPPAPPPPSLLYSHMSAC